MSAGRQLPVALQLTRATQERRLARSLSARNCREQMQQRGWGLLDHFSSLREHGCRYLETNCLGCFEIEDEFKLGWELYR
jgi:hypothetical protein